ncbi:hypothetical protein RFI_31089 [Reticulomyxa filosa]|uniref:Uncharacterized protein n=1 Tax=Reticulomyxa filosa TaxID=46433 RepID=X6LWK3_RETFI|nr:hypothetical protein RFI_31089 [Reticulomyxa filosa]|eukprot:ETO06308.1 hypothetical protein RFI_31089 [Reticulomyxa filosa]
MNKQKRSDIGKESRRSVVRVNKQRSVGSYVGVQLVHTFTQKYKYDANTAISKTKAQTELMKWLGTEQEQLARPERLERCQQLLFDLLQAVYNTIKKYKTEVYLQIKDILGIKHIISKTPPSNDKTKEQQEKELTQYIFQFYLRKYSTELLDFYQEKFKEQEFKEQGKFKNQDQVMQDWTQQNSRNGQPITFPSLLVFFSFVLIE